MTAEIVDHVRGAVVVGAVEARGSAGATARVHVDSVIDQISGRRFGRLYFALPRKSRASLLSTPPAPRMLASQSSM